MIDAYYRMLTEPVLCSVPFRSKQPKDWDFSAEHFKCQAHGSIRKCHSH